MAASKSQLAQYLIDKIKRDIAMLQEEEITKWAGQALKKTDIELIWVAGHMGSEGNEAADTLAKQAAEFRSDSICSLPVFLHRPLPTSLSATKQYIGKITKQHTKAWWRQSK